MRNSITVIILPNGNKCNVRVVLRKPNFHAINQSRVVEVSQLLLETKQKSWATHKETKAVS